MGSGKPIPTSCYSERLDVELRAGNGDLLLGCTVWAPKGEPPPEMIPGTAFVPLSRLGDIAADLLRRGDWYRESAPEVRPVIYKQVPRGTFN